MASKASHPLLNAVIDRLPVRAVNCTTFVTTKVIAREPSHPLCIKTRRKLAAFDPQGFYWRVNCPTDISKKAIVRNTCKGEFKKAFVWALAEAGWGKDGMPLDPDGTQKRLTGAVLLSIVKDPARVLTAKKEAMRRDAGDVVKKLAARQGQPVYRNSSRPSERPARASRFSDREGSIGREPRSTMKSKPGASYKTFNPTGTEP